MVYTSCQMFRLAGEAKMSEKRTLQCPWWMRTDYTGTQLFPILTVSTDEKMVSYKKDGIMTTVSPARAIYWGEGGEYGPFDVQTEGEWAGWPDFGQVQGYFRQARNMSKQQFAVVYGKETKPNGSPISIRQVRRMEHENDVPTDMNKRKLIARLLNIPPMLFGLATLQEVILQPHPEKAGASLATGYTMLPKVVADTSKYQSNIRTFLTLHYTSQAQSALDQINADIRDLESLETQARGDLQHHIRELLYSYHILVSQVARDQKNYSLSRSHANQAVRVAKAMNDTDLIATALFTRGFTYLNWGMHGTIEQGVFQVQIDKINKAIRDFENAKQTGENTEKRLHPHLLGRIDLRLARAYSIRSVTQGRQVPSIAITMLDDAEEYVDCESIADTYERYLVTGGSLINFGKDFYHNEKARGLYIQGRSGAALKEIQSLEKLRERSIGKQFTRDQAWIDIVTADVYMGLEQFEEATKRTKSALIICQDIQSVANLDIIEDIHGRLLQSPYKAESEVKELGDMIEEAKIKQTE